MLGHPATRYGRAIGTIILIILITFLLGLTIASCKAGPTTSKEAVVPSSVIFISQCNKTVGAIFAMSDGSLHPIDLSKVPFEAVTNVVDKLPDDSEHRLNAIGKCTIDGQNNA